MRMLFFLSQHFKSSKHLIKWFIASGIVISILVILLILVMLGMKFMNDYSEGFGENISLTPSSSDEVLEVGRLKLNGTLAIADPIYMAGNYPDRVEIRNIPSGEYPVYIWIKQIDTDKRISWASLKVRDVEPDKFKIYESFPVDAGLSSYTSLEDYVELHQEEGVEKIGYISKNFEYSEQILGELNLTFKDDGNMYKINEPVPEEVSLRIIERAKELDPNLKFPFTILYVKTNNTFDQLVDKIEENSFTTYDYGVLDLDQQTNIIALSSGYGDGYYPVIIGYKNGEIVRVDINFLLEDE